MTAEKMDYEHADEDIEGIGYLSCLIVKKEVS